MRPYVLVILDGFGYRVEQEHNAIYHAHPGQFLWLWEQYPHAILKAAGKNAGLLDGMMGNSEVGHLTLGAGRVIKQPVSLLHEQIDSGVFFKNKLLGDLFTQVRSKNKTLHVMGLLSDSGVHSHEYHLYAILKMAREHKLKNIVVHPFLDGRDVSMRSASLYLEKLDAWFAQEKCGMIGSLHGRFYAMDRDKNWERTEQSYQVLTSPQKKVFKSWQDVINLYYSVGITDEFIQPSQLVSHMPGVLPYMTNGDALVFFNVREDRARQLAAAFIQTDFSYFPRLSLNLEAVVTAIPYSPLFKNQVLCHKDLVKNTFLDVIEAAGKSIFTIAETEKYAAVTYFFNGGCEVSRAREVRVFIPSLAYRTYADHPSMSAKHITDNVIESLKNNPKDIYLINYANADMVGHSGDFKATVQAVQCIDEQLKILYQQVVEQMNGTLIITADHGKAEEMKELAGDGPRTAHTANPVPFILVNKLFQNKKMTLPLTQLSDVAPFLLDGLELPIPAEMKRSRFSF